MTKGWPSTQNPTQARKPAPKIWLIVSRSCDPLSGRRRSLVRFVGFIGYSCLIGDPVNFPSLTAIIRICLLEVGRTRGDAGPDISNEDSSAINGVLAEKLAASILEFADLGWTAHAANPAVGPIEAPLMR